MKDTVILRRFQARYAMTALNKFESDEKVVVADVHPGSGKTLAVLHVANEMFRRGLIDTCMVFVPRLNLCRQFELDWKEYQSEWYSNPKMSSITHRDNEPPLLRDGAFGYVTTYASLVFNPKLHIEFAKRHPRSMLIVDEAQGLGTHEGSGGTKAADYIANISEHVKYIQVVTGTPYRSDGNPLLFANYTDPDDEGIRHLEPDVSATYLEGVTESYLRPFEYELADGTAIHEYLGGSEELLRISEMEKNLYRVLEDEGFWSTMVDMVIKRVHEVQQQIDPRLCGLIGAHGQEQARKILRYIKKYHPGIKALIAVSDEQRSQKNLKQFKRGGHDILITVRMAYIGYDHKPISVVLMLSDFRDYGFLDQFFARGMRIMPDIPIEKQVLYAIVPDDPQMAKYVEEKRKESERGLRERGQQQHKLLGSSEQRPIGFTYGGEVTNRRAQGMNPDGDLNIVELPIVEQIQAKYQMTASPRTELGRLFRDMGESVPSAAEKLGIGIPRMPVKKREELTAKEREEKARRELSKMARRCDRKLAEIQGNEEIQYGLTYTECNSHFGRLTIKKAGLEEIEESIKWIQKVFEPSLDEQLNQRKKH